MVALKMLPNGNSHWQKHPLLQALWSCCVACVSCFHSGLLASVMRVPCAGAGVSRAGGPYTRLPPSPTPRCGAAGAFCQRGSEMVLNLLLQPLTCAGAVWAAQEGWAVRPCPVPLAGLWSAGTAAPESIMQPWEERLIPASSPCTLLFRHRLCAFQSNEKYNYAARIP